MIRSTLHNIRKGKTNSSNAETMTVVAMASVTMIFFPILVLLTQSSLSASVAPVQLPIAFNLSTIIIIASSIVLAKANAVKQQDHYKKYKLGLVITFVLSILFIILQWAGWTSLMKQYHMENVTINYIIVLVIIHGAHLLMGIVVLIWLLKKAYPLKSGAEFYIHFLKPKHELGHRILNHYWHFIGILWVFMYVVMLIKIA
jgi:cytochrome c oxidase subunit III